MSKFCILLKFNAQLSAAYLTVILKQQFRSGSRICAFPTFFARGEEERATAIMMAHCKGCNLKSPVNPIIFHNSKL